MKLSIDEGTPIDIFKMDDNNRKTLGWFKLSTCIITSLGTTERVLQLKLVKSQDMGHVVPALLLIN